ncbi:MAG: hypothetical protein WD795_17010 [Woeseia sp.]
MLTDIFATRYADVPMWDEFRDRDRRFIVQGFRLVNERLYPPEVSGGKSEQNEAKWKLLHDKLSTELGLIELSQRWYSYQRQYGDKSYPQTGYFDWSRVCKTYLLKEYASSFDADAFIKKRLSFYELALREKESEVNEKWDPATLAAKKLEAQLLGKRTDAAGMHEHALREAQRKYWDDVVHEFNTRLRQAGYKLHYHNGFVQVSEDEIVARQIEEPFWTLVADPKWKNVDTDMKEAVDRRDTGGRDPAWYAARALESAIKIISQDKGWTRGTEKGAAHYIDNLVSSKNGRYIDVWESENLKHFFGNVRADLGHGPGAEPMPELRDQQTNWAIEFCMSWIRSLINRR